jgi:hypothetical protein
MICSGCCIMRIALSVQAASTSFGFGLLQSFLQVQFQVRIHFSGGRRIFEAAIVYVVMDLACDGASHNSLGGPTTLRILLWQRLIFDTGFKSRAFFASQSEFRVNFSSALRLAKVRACD